MLGGGEGLADSDGQRTYCHGAGLPTAAVLKRAFAKLPLCQTGKVLVWRKDKECCLAGQTGQAHPRGLLATVNAFWQIEGGGEVVNLAQRQGDADRLVGLGIKLFQYDTIFISLDNDVFGQRGSPLINEGDHGRVEFMFDGKHFAIIGGSEPSFNRAA